MTDQPIRIIIVEDDFFVSEEIKRILEGSKYEVIGTAFNGEEAVEMACDLAPEVILMDIKMPHKDGLEASREIAEQCPVPIVILTAYDSVPLVEEASLAGVAAFLCKPPNFAEMDRAITIARARFNDLQEICQLNNKLKKALAEIKTLKGIIPICSYCKNIRDDKGFWNQVDVYVKEHSNAEFSHGVCPECLKEHYSMFLEDIED